ncbi:hypothetical protein CF326_g9150 [Tilletia indica]|nr:hypothetical protein CF326_g9150 [Tilletia indica]
MLEIVSWCQSRGLLEDVWASVEACWRFINNAPVLPDSATDGKPTEVDAEDTLTWQISATGHGAEADKGTTPLDDAWREFQPLGIDGRAGMIWGTGAGAWLASLAAARLHPAPIAVVLERPLLDLTVPIPELPALPRIVREPPPFPYTDSPSFPGISDWISWFENMEANEEEYWRKNSGMDVRRHLPGERDGAQMPRMAIDAYEQGRRRGCTIATAYSLGKVPSTSAAAFPAHPTITSHPPSASQASPKSHSAKPSTSAMPSAPQAPKAPSQTSSSLPVVPDPVRTDLQSKQV